MNESFLVLFFKKEQSFFLKNEAKTFVTFDRGKGPRGRVHKWRGGA